MDSARLTASMQSMQQCVCYLKYLLMLADAANAVRDVLRTVAQCHARNVLIRDVKPDNFLYLTSDENAPLKAIDFGLAQYCKADENLRDRAGVTQHAPQGLHTCLNAVQRCLFLILFFLIFVIFSYVMFPVYSSSRFPNMLIICLIPHFVCTSKCHRLASKQALLVINVCSEKPTA